MFGLVGEDFLTHIFDRIGYLAPLFVLVGAGAGLPIPEEVTLLGSGFLLFQGRVEFLPIVLTCYAGTLIGDSIPFWLGRKLGMSAMDHRWIRKVVHPERRVLLEERFERHGNWGVFTCRFLPGVRLPGFFTAGSLGMSYPRFLACDGAAALIMAPTWILIGRAFGEKIQTLEERVQHLNQILGFGLLAILVAIGVHLRVRRRERQVAELDLDRDDHPPAGQGE